MDRLQLGSVTIDEATDLTALFRQQLKRGEPWGRRDDLANEDGLVRSLEQIKGTAFESFARDALFGLIRDGDPDVGNGAVATLGRVPIGITPGQVLGVIEANPPLVPPERSRALLNLIANKHPTDPRVIDRLKTAARDPDHGADVLEGLTVSDPIWVVANARTAVAGKASRAQIILAWLRDPAQRQAFVQALTAEPAGLRAEIAQAIRDVIQDRREQQRLTDLLH
ncbi:MAG: hypothetical protein E6I56_04850 [Chloroflexi bacterium]|nr:MAG: hypothetical protein E6I56_04850 [Chloroflexota bacterium]